MMLQPTPITSITHPLIASAYLKKSMGREMQSQDVLVIETRTEHDGMTKSARNDQWVDFLSDLDMIIDQMDRKGCKFDTVEIRRH